eukprot:2976848-Pyramimonas_sp.AAC.1
MRVDYTLLTCSLQTCQEAEPVQALLAGVHPCGAVHMGFQGRRGGLVRIVPWCASPGGGERRRIQGHPVLRRPPRRRGG